MGPAQFAESARVIREGFGTVAEEMGFTRENNPTNGAFLQPDKLLEEYEKGVAQFGLFQDGVQVGFVAVEEANRQLYYLEKLAVVPGARHRGCGKQLMDHARQYVAQRGGREISIAIINENTRLKRWYEAYGFMETGLKHFEHLSFTVCFMSLTV